MNHDTTPELIIAAAASKSTWAGVLSMFFGWVRDDDGRWFCSEALMAALGFDEAWRFGPNGAAAAIKRWCRDTTNQPATSGIF